MNVSTAAKDVPLTEAWKPFLSRLNFHFASSFPSAAFVFVCPPHLATSCAKKPPKSPEREQPPAAPETNKTQMKTRARMDAYAGVRGTTKFSNRRVRSRFAAMESQDERPEPIRA